MAVDGLTQLRRWTDEPLPDSIYSDSELSDRLSSADSPYAAARDIWMEKLASASAFVNVSEGGSSRSMDQMFQHCLKMVDLYTGLASGPVGSPNGVTLRRISRS